MCDYDLTHIWTVVAKHPDVKCHIMVYQLLCKLKISSKIIFSSSCFFSAGRHCPQDEFQCNNTLCKPLAWKCDGEDDCGDNSDENPEQCSECSLVNRTHLKYSQKSYFVLNYFSFPFPPPFVSREVPVSSHQSFPLPQRPRMSASVKEM